MNCAPYNVYSILPEHKRHDVVGNVRVFTKQLFYFGAVIVGGMER